MTPTVRELLAEVDRSPAPDVWDEAGSRRPRSMPPEGDRGPRIRAAVVGVALAAVAVSLVMVSFRGSPADEAPAGGVQVITAERGATIAGHEALPQGVIAGEGSVFFATGDQDGEGGTVAVIDNASRIVREIPIDVPPGWETGGGGITTGLGAAWIAGTVASPGSDCDLCQDVALTRVDPVTGATEEIIVGPGNGADVWVDETGIWVLAFARHEPQLWLYRLEPSTYEVLGRTEIDSGWSRQVFAAGGWLWVFGSTRGEAPAETLFRIDPSTGRVVDELDLEGRDLWDVEPSGSWIWYCDRGLRAVDAATGGPAVGPVDGTVADTSCVETVADGDGGVWLLEHPDRVVHVGTDGSIDADGSVPFGQPISQATFDPTTDMLWVMNYEDLRGFRLTLADASTTTSPSPREQSASARVGIYEAVVRQLVDPQTSGRISIDPVIDTVLMESDVTAPPDPLSRAEQEELSVRLGDLGDVTFDRDQSSSPDSRSQRILLGPIVATDDGFRVEGGSVCGGLCGSGRVYVVVASEGGYEVTGTDDSYGSWIA
jgi:hypothetical protein